MICVVWLRTRRPQSWWPDVSDLFACSVAEVAHDVDEVFRTKSARAPVAHNHAFRVSIDIGFPSPLSKGRLCASILVVYAYAPIEQMGGVAVAIHIRLPFEVVVQLLDICMGQQVSRNTK